MAPSRSHLSWLGHVFTILSVLSLSISARAFHLYMEGQQTKCFFEELPKDTLVAGHYMAEIFNQQSNSFVVDTSLAMVVTVDETFENDHRVVYRRTGHSDRFTVTAAESGLHKICFSPEPPSSGIGSGATVKLTLDVAFGETSKIESEDKGKIADIVKLVKSLNSRLQDIRREQVFQREREAEFRDQSETTNARVVRWTLIQTAVLSVTCAWQLSHLRAFFIKQKLT
ncbi:emp24/gp25L/p24 family/GOLD domain containing protein [Elaphomyces granulatus]